MIARVHAGCLVGIEARPVEVEVHLGAGLPGFDIVGLAEAAVRESRVRVKAALSNSGYELPPRQVVLNLAPADLRKRGTTFDLAIAVALLTATGACAPNMLDDTLLLGELSLAGDVRSVRGLLPQLRSGRDRGMTRAIVATGHAREATLVPNIDVRLAATLAEVVAFLCGQRELPSARSIPPSARPMSSRAEPDLAEVRGQEAGKRALEIAAAGGHDILFVGPPGAGKTMLARRLPGILPPPTAEERLAIATIASAAGLDAGDGSVRPFRAPHHTASAVALVGGGDPVRPGEVTLAHGGVLFLDELPELGRQAIESLRTTMEAGIVAVARARERVVMPARPLVVAAMNPCPCGFRGDPTRLCTCSPSRVEQYRARVSGPIVDRFDLHVTLPPVRIGSLGETPDGERSDAVRQRVAAARERALRAGDLGPDGRPPSAASTLTRDLASLEGEARQLLERAGERLGLSMRGCARALRVARTIAHLDASPIVAPMHLAEALSYRQLDRRSAEGRADASA